MPFQFDHAQQCPTCPFGVCIEDRRANPVPGRKTKFRLRQAVALNCTFEEFLPGSPGDDDPTRPFADYLRQFTVNARAAGAHLFGDEFVISGRPAHRSRVRAIARSTRGCGSSTGSESPGRGCCA